MSTTQANEKQVEWLTARLKPLIVQQLGFTEADIQLSSRFVEDLLGDSLDTIELVMAVEDEFDIEIDDSQAETITCLENAIPVLHPIMMQRSIEYQLLG